MGEGSQLTELVVGIMSSSAPILAAVAALFFYVHKLMAESNRRTESLRQELVGKSESLRQELVGKIDNGLAEARVEFREGLAEARRERAELRKDIRRVDENLRRVEVNVARIAGHVIGVEEIKNAMTEDEATEDEAA